MGKEYNQEFNFGIPRAIDPIDMLVEQQKLAIAVAENEKEEKERRKQLEFDESIKTAIPKKSYVVYTDREKRHINLNQESVLNGTDFATKLVKALTKQMSPQKLKTLSEQDNNTLRYLDANDRAERNFNILISLIAEKAYLDLGLVENGGRYTKLESEIRRLSNKLNRTGLPSNFTFTQGDIRIRTSYVEPGGVINGDDLITWAPSKLVKIGTGSAMITATLTGCGGSAAIPAIETPVRKEDIAGIEVEVEIEPTVIPAIVYPPMTLVSESAMDISTPEAENVDNEPETIATEEVTATNTSEPEPTQTAVATDEPEVTSTPESKPETNTAPTTWNDWHYAKDDSQIWHYDRNNPQRSKEEMKDLERKIIELTTIEGENTSSAEILMFNYITRMWQQGFIEGNDREEAETNFYKKYMFVFIKTKDNWTIRILNTDTGKLIQAESSDGSQLNFGVALGIDEYEAFNLVVTPGDTLIHSEDGKYFTNIETDEDGNALRYQDLVTGEMKETKLEFPSHLNVTLGSYLADPNHIVHEDGSPQYIYVPKPETIEDGETLENASTNDETSGNKEGEWIKDFERNFDLNKYARNQLRMEDFTEGHIEEFFEKILQYEFQEKTNWDVVEDWPLNSGGIYVKYWTTLNNNIVKFPDEDKAPFIENTGFCGELVIDENHYLYILDARRDVDNKAIEYVNLMLPLQKDGIPLTEDEIKDKIRILKNMSFYPIGIWTLDGPETDPLFEPQRDKSNDPLFSPDMNKEYDLMMEIFSDILEKEITGDMSRLKKLRHLAFRTEAIEYTEDDFDGKLTNAYK